MRITDIPILSMLRQRMEWHQEHQRVLAENVADADTPNYRARDLAPVEITSRQIATTLRYDDCVAKGVDLIARKIREVAEAHGIPVVENPPLARALHGTVEIDQEIPQEHYRAVAEIIGYLMRLRRLVAR
jgi:type III secretion system FlhB-like substrate exporter